MPKPRRTTKLLVSQDLRRNSAVKLRGQVVEDPLKKRPRKQSSPASGITVSKVAIWQFSAKTNKIKWNLGSQTFFNLGANEKLPATVDELIGWVNNKERRSFRDLFRRAIREEIVFVGEAKVFLPDGSFKWLEFIAEPQVLKSGRISNYAGIIQDITVRKLTEFELHDWKTRNELVSESAGLLIYDYDIASGEIIWSGNNLQIVGHTSAEMGTVDLWEQLVHPDDREQANAALEKAKNELKPYDVYYRFKHKNQGYCYIHDRGLFVPDATGYAVRMLGIMNDVSKRVEADRTIQQSEKSYRELFNTVGEAIYIQKNDGTFVDVNQGACNMYGYAKEEFIGRTPEFLSAPGKNDFEALGKHIELALQGIPQSFRWWGKKKSGEVFIKNVNITRGTYFGDEIIIATAWDITDRINAEQSLKESELRFRRLVSDLQVGVILMGARGEVHVANKASRCMLELSEELTEALLTREFDLVQEDGKPLEQKDIPWVAAAHTKIAMRGVVIGIRRSNGSVVWVLTNAEPVVNDESTLLNVVITLTDITERKKIEEDLKESELRFRTLQEASFGGIGLHSQGTILDCNQGLCNITGFTYEELIGSNGVNLIAPEYRDFVVQKITSRSEEPYDVQGIRKDGTRYYLEIHGKNIPYKDGLIRVTEFRDITDRKASEAKILEQNARLLSITEDLKLKNEQLQEFTQIVSHNLRSPVGNILSLLQFMEGAETNEERSEYIGLLKEAGISTLTTLQELNDVLKIKQDKNIQKQLLEFDQVFSNVRRMLVAKIVEGNAEIITHFSDAPTIEYPNIYLESIMLNLLSNALKYSHPDRKPVIQVKTFRHNGSVCLEIRDNGVGLNMERHGHHIFKLRKTFHKHPESRGIGLFMIKNQIEAMGGDISMSSVENVGSVFLVNFSARIQDDER